MRFAERESHEIGENDEDHEGREDPKGCQDHGRGDNVKAKVTSVGRATMVMRMLRVMKGRACETSRATFSLPTHHC